MVTITSSSIHGNQATSVRAHAQKFPRPNGTDVLASTLTCASAADAPVNYTGGACRRDLEMCPSAPWETHVWLVVCRVVVSLSGVAQ
jgi:hypothetical protein